MKINYSYETIVKDACWPAVEGYCHLATGIDEVKNDFNSLYGTDLTFNEALKLFDKTEQDYIKDVITTFKQLKRTNRKN
jgi:hypothetical protein